MTARTDLYAWGLIFLECLTGKRVVEGARLQDLIFKQLGPEPVLLPEWLASHRLGRLLRRATEKNPQARDVTAQGLLLELESCETQGWPSAETPMSPVLAQQPPSASEEERRHLTAVCCSLRLVGEGADAVKAEELDALLWKQHAAWVELARRREGWLGSVLGERVLLYFGYPKAHEDDAPRAAFTALELMAQMEKRGAELSRSHGLKAEVRVGIHTGPVLSRELRGQGLSGLPVLVGHTPGVAERLEALAQPGELLVSETTAQTLGEGFVLEPAGAHRVGVGTRSMPVLRLRGRQRASTSGLERTPTSPLLGRTLELELLMQRWRQVQARDGAGRPAPGRDRLRQVPAGAGARPSGAPHAAHLPGVPLRSGVARHRPAAHGGAAGAAAGAGPGLDAGAGHRRDRGAAHPVRLRALRVPPAVRRADVHPGRLGPPPGAGHVRAAPAGADGAGAAGLCSSRWPSGSPC